MPCYGEVFGNVSKEDEYLRIFYAFKVTERYLAQLLAVGLKTQITSLNPERKKNGKASMAML